MRKAAVEGSRAEQKRSCGEGQQSCGEGQQSTSYREGSRAKELR
jgi:hypothetical protein